MLALTRKIGERIVIGNGIIVTVADIRGDNIRLAIDAPRDVKIYRGEIYDAIVAENRQAAVPAQDKFLEAIKDIKSSNK